MPAKTRNHKNNDTAESTVTFYPSFQALADAAKNREEFETPPPPARPSTLRSALDFPRRPVEWLWPEKIPLGKVTLLIGDPGLGKTLIALDVAARTSTGSAFPNTLPPAPCPELSPPGSVLILSANDEIADTIRPRLDAHGADPAKIFFDSDVTDLRHDLAHLEATLDEIPDCRLIIVDPVNAFVGPSDSHFHTVVRKVLAPLAELAAQRRIAILAVTHLRKNTGRAIQSAAGSMGLVAAARTVWTVCRDPADASRNLLLPVKNNVGPLTPGLAYTVETHAELDAPVIRWQAEPIDNTAEDIAKPMANSRDPQAEERREAGEWLQTALAAGPRDSWFVLQEAHQHGFSDRTLRRALHAIGGITRKESFDAGWIWSLPDPSHFEKSPSTPLESDAKQPGRFDETWPLRENPEKNCRPMPPPHPSPTRVVGDPPIAPTVDESLEFLTRLDARRREIESIECNDPSSATGHAALDQLLTNFRSSLRSPAPCTCDSQTSASNRAKKSTRSPSRLPTGTDSWHFTRPADPCESGAMHPGGVSAQVADESTTRRRADAIQSLPIDTARR